MSRAAQPVETRLKSRVEIDAVTGCWLWQGALDRSGYGQINVDGKTMLAHRVSHTLFNGDIPDGHFVLHACDTPRCIAPAHLSTGTHDENMREMVERDRSAHGERHGSARLSLDDVREIKRLHSEGHASQSALAMLYEISRTQVWNIVHGHKWREA
jgi:hypothetical protein